MATDDDDADADDDDDDDDDYVDDDFVCFHGETCWHGWQLYIATGLVLFPSYLHEVEKVRIQGRSPLGPLGPKLKFTECFRSTWNHDLLAQVLREDRFPIRRCKLRA